MVMQYKELKLESFKYANKFFIEIRIRRDWISDKKSDFFQSFVDTSLN